MLVTALEDSAPIGCISLVSLPTGMMTLICSVHFGRRSAFHRNILYFGHGGVIQKDGLVLGKIWNVAVTTIGVD